MTIVRCSRVALVVGTVLMCAAGLARAQDVTYNSMPGTDFTQFKSYKWVQVEGGVHPDQIVDHQITQAIDAELATKGLTKTDDPKADLYIDYQVAVNQEKELTAYGGGMGYRMGGMASATTSTINIGTLGVDMYDSSAKQLVWRGSATKTLDANPKPQKRQDNIEKATKKLLKNFPPPAK